MRLVHETWTIQEHALYSEEVDAKQFQVTFKCEKGHEKLAHLDFESSQLAVEQIFKIYSNVPVHVIHGEIGESL